MRPDAWARNTQMIGQDENRALGIEKADDVVVIGDAAAAVRDVTQTIAAKWEQPFAFSVFSFKERHSLPSRSHSQLTCRRWLCRR
jgi:hypothetical protein